MKQKNQQTGEIEMSDLPVTSSVKVQRQRGYGSIPDLDDEAPADINELQRMVAWQQYEPLLILPGRHRRGYIALDTSGEVDWDAIGPAGRRRQPERRDRSERTEQLRTELIHVLSLIATASERVPGNAKYLVLKHVRMGILHADHVTDASLREVIRLQARAERLRQELATAASRRSRPAAPAITAAAVRR